MTKMNRMKSIIGWEPAKSAEEAIACCVIANRILEREGALDTFGHVGIRNPEDPDTFFQSRALAPSLVTKADILKIDFDGNVLTESDARPYGERVIQARILKNRPDINAVYHGHPREVVVMSALDIPIRAMASFCGMYHTPLPVYTENGEDGSSYVGTVKAADLLARTVGSGIGVIMRRHGSVVTGLSAANMISNAICLRDAAGMQLTALSVGEPNYLSEAEGAVNATLLRGAFSLERNWRYWLSRIKLDEEAIF